MFQEELLGAVAQNIKMGVCRTCEKELEPGEDCPDCGPADTSDDWQDSEEDADAEEGGADK